MTKDEAVVIDDVETPAGRSSDLSFLNETEAPSKASFEVNAIMVKARKASSLKDQIKKQRIQNLVDNLLKAQNV